MMDENGSRMSPACVVKFDKGLFFRWSSRRMSENCAELITAYVHREKGEDIVIYNSPILYARFPRHSTLPPTLKPQPTVDRPTPPTLSPPQPDPH